MPVPLKDVLARKSPERRAAIEADAARMIAEEKGSATKRYVVWWGDDRSVGLGEATHDAESDARRCFEEKCGANGVSIVELFDYAHSTERPIDEWFALDENE